jgi:23S rRNA (uracil1939-C5)-methyltransferase
VRKRRPIQKSQRLPEPIELEIERYSHDGRGIGIFQGRVVMVANAMPTERVKVKIEQANTKLWQGKAIEYLQKSESRQEPICSFYGECGGCVLQHVPQQDQRELKQKALADHLRRNDVKVKEWAEPIASVTKSYRHRARFQVSKKGEVGFYNIKGNRIVTIDHCSVVQEEINSALKLLQANAPLEGVKQVEIVIDDHKQLGIAVIEGSGVAKKAIEQWGIEQGWVAAEPLQYKAAGAETLAVPGNFTQVNRGVNAEMIEQAKAWLSINDSDRLLDLFCGNGNVSLPFSNDVHSILGLEASDKAIELAMQSPSRQENSQYQVANLINTKLEDLPNVVDFEPTCVILDPPRAGAELVVNNMNALPSIQKILYISCDPATFARDLSTLVSDKWHLRKVGVMDMFPHTRHIESMALLEKKKTGHLK